MGNDDLNVLIIFASPHEDGYTAKLLNEYINFLPDTYKLHFYNVYKNQACPCIDCSLCKNTNKCVYDDTDEFFEKLNISNIIIIASPVYNLTFTPPLLALFSRFQPYFFANNNKTEKFTLIDDRAVVLLTTSGRKSEKAIEIMCLQAKYIFNSINAKLISNIHIGMTDKRDFFIDKSKIIKSIGSIKEKFDI